MTEEQAEEAAAKVVARAKSESMNVLQARAYAASLGLEITPAYLAQDGDENVGAVYRSFIFVTDEGTRRKLKTRIHALDIPEPGAPSSPKELVNHPSHYNMGGPKEADGTARYEVIKVIEDWELGFKLGNALKYILRAPHKGTEEQDLNKARWYLDRQSFSPDPTTSQDADALRVCRFSAHEVADGWKLGTELAAAVFHIQRRDAPRAILDLDTHIIGKR